MRLRFLLPILLLLIAPVAAFAQEDVTPTPNTAELVDRAETAALRAEALAESASASLELAQTYVNDAARYAADASSFLGIFEAVSVAITIAVGALGVIGVVRIFSAQNELTRTSAAVREQLAQARENFEQALREKQDELDALKTELRNSADFERTRSEQATLALSLLPLAERQYRAKDLDGALDTYHRALELDSENLVIHYRLGYVYMQADRLEEATRHLERALAIEPNFAPALASMGYVLRRRAESMGMDKIERGEVLADAERYIRRALKLSPKLVDEDGESWWGSLGGLHQRRGQLEDAIDAYTRAQEVTPQASYPLGNLALLYLRKGDRARMLDMYAKVERLAARQAVMDVTDFWAYADLLVARAVLGEMEGATAAMEAMFDAAPADAPGMLNKPLNTLRQLADGLGGEDAERMAPLIERIEQRLLALERAAEEASV